YGRGRHDRAQLLRLHRHGRTVRCRGRDGSRGADVAHRGGDGDPADLPGPLWQQPPAASGGVRSVPTWLPKVAAICFVVVSALVLVFVYHGFRGSFTPGVKVTVESGRSGLMLEDGAMVKAHGVHVGSVTTVQQTPSGAVIELRLDPDAAARLPADPGADIRATTVFGAKYVTLTDPPSPGPVGLTEGTVLRASNVTVET